MKNPISNIQEINLSEIKKAITDSGYLIEQRVESVIEKFGYYVETNPVFKDIDTGVIQEIDVTALAGISIYRGKTDFIFPMIICECENNIQPVVFFVKDFAPFFMFYEEMKCSGIPLKINTKGEVVDLSTFLGFDKFHHYCKGPFATQYCSFQQKKDTKTWMASHLESQHNTFVKLIKALEFEIIKHDKSWQPPMAGEREPVNIQMYYPLLILQGNLLAAKLKNRRLIVEKINHIQFRKQYISPKGENTYQIDVITESFLSKFMTMIDKETELIKARLIRKRKYIEQAINEIVLERKKKIETRKNLVPGFRINGK